MLIGDTYAPSSIRRAAENMIREMGEPPSGNVLIICSHEEAALSAQLAAVLDEQSIENHTLTLGLRLSSSLDELRHLVENIAGRWGLIVLLQPQHASFLFKVVGRPDSGIRIPEKYLLCDWLTTLPALIRTYDIDWEQLMAFRQNLLARLSGAKQIHVVTAAGTDLLLHPRVWRSSTGEVYTAPIERLTEGAIFVDGCAYGGPPETPFLLKISQGKVTNLNDLNLDDRQQKWVRTDLTRDDNSQVLAEFGIGINPGALANSHLMEAEQAAGTCHFGFGNNLAYGGMNPSSYHFDLVVLAPTIEVDGTVVMRSGKFL
jgi:hypothetical protein